MAGNVSGLNSLANWCTWPIEACQLAANNGEESFENGLVGIGELVCV